MSPQIALQTRVPDPGKKHVQSFCESLVPGGTPFPIAIDAEAHAEANDCFNIVKAKVATCGGTPIFGWAIWEWPGVLIEAEFHAIWKDESGSLRDISPAPDGVSSRLFLPDPSCSYEGKQVNNVRHPLTDNPEVRRLIAAQNAFFEVMNKSERAYMHTVSIPEKELLPVTRERQQAMDELMRRKVGRNDPCLLATLRN
jgi:hypothetical protein